MNTSFPSIATDLLEDLPLAALSRALADVLNGAEDASTNDEITALFESAWDDLELPQRARMLEALIACGLREGQVTADAPEVVQSQRMVEQLLLPVPARYPVGLQTVRDLLGQGQGAQAQLHLHALLRGAVQDLCGPGSAPLAVRVAQLPVAPELREHVQGVAAMLREHPELAWQCLWLARLLDGLCDGGHQHPAVLIGDDALMLQRGIGEL